MMEEKQREPSPLTPCSQRRSTVQNVHSVRDADMTPNHQLRQTDEEHRTALLFIDR
jgi:hypothetical protein